MKRLALFLLALKRDPDWQRLGVLAVLASCIGLCGWQAQMERINTRGVTVRNSSNTTVTTLDQSGTVTLTQTGAGSYTFGGSAIDTSAWNASTIRGSATDNGNANRFEGTLQFQLNPSTNNLANIEKGPLFLRCVHADNTATVTPNCVGIDALGQIVSGNLQGNVWGGVHRVQIDSGGEGWAIGDEVDVTNNGASVNAHQDSATPHVKTAIWIGTFGSNPTSWLFDETAAGPGALNGIALRNIVPGGMGIEFPNNIGAYWRNAAGNGDLNVLNVDGSNNVIVGAPSGSSIFFQINGAGLGNVSGSGWNLTGGVNGLSVNSTNTLKLGSTVVGSLPSAASNTFAQVGVTDSTAIASEGQTCVGGSSNKAIAISNGSVWKCF